MIELCTPKYSSVKKNWLIIIVSLAAFLLDNSGAYAWGKEGHYLVADIASAIMKKNVKDNVQQFLGEMSFEEAADWMDEVRSQHEDDYMKTWHYINLEKGESYVPGDGDNIIDRLNITCKQLANKQNLSTEAIHTDLLIIFHLVGDLFQPLHVGYGSDRGGNTYQVYLNGRGTNLHAVWDKDIIEEENITLDDCMALYNSLSGTQIAYIKNAGFEKLMNDNRKLLDQLYPAGHTIDNNYLHKNKLIVERQLVYAGIKLDAVLETLFYSPDTRLITQAKVEKISASDAAKYIGKKEMVCAEVYEVKDLSNVSFLDAGNSYPNNPLTIVVFARDRANFKNGLEIYDHKNICVTGTIKEYKGKPEIIINGPGEISVE